jgi:hypothetical protein
MFKKKLMKNENIHEFSDKNETPVAIIKGGRNDKNIVLLTDKNNSQTDLKIVNLFDYINEKEIRKKKKYMKTSEIINIRDAFENRKPIMNNLKGIYEELRKQVDFEKNKSLKIYDGVFNMLPLVNNEDTNQRDAILVAGQSGVGKSVYISQYIENYKKLFNGNEVYLFSKIEDDKAFNNLDIKRIVIDEKILEYDFDLLDFKNSLVIFDDYSVSDTNINKKIEDMIHQLLEKSRKQQTYIIVVNHLLQNNTKQTKSIIFESTKYVIFPRCSSKYQLNRFLREYMGLDKIQIQKIYSLNTRAVCINKSVIPNVIIADHDIYIL